jgi:hypothetical protein
MARVWAGNGVRMIGILGRIQAALASRAEYGRLKARMFSGRPILVEIGRHELQGRVSLSLLYRNGLILTLGEEGILDFQDKDFGQFLKGPGFGNRQALAYLHKIVLKSLIRYMVHPSLAMAQRERAAEAASKLYLAEVEATTDWIPGPAAAVMHGSLAEKSLVRP